MDIQAINADLQALADKYQAHFTGTVTPVAVETDAFDVTVTAVAPTPVDAPADQPVA